MKNKELLDIYSDYLISAFGQTTGTALAGLLGDSINFMTCLYHAGATRCQSGSR